MSASRLDARLSEGLSRHQAGDLHAAREIYCDILDAEPGHPGAAMWLGVMAVQVGQPDKGEQLLRIALAGDPGSALAHANLANALMAQDRVEEALVFYKAAVELDRHFAEGYYNLGQCLRKLGHMRPAVAAYDCAVMLRPNFADAWHNKGIAAAELGDREEAAAAFRRYLAIQPHDQNGARLRLAALGLEPEPERAEPAYVAALFDSYAPAFDAHLVETLGYQAPQLCRAAADGWLRRRAAPVDILDLGCGTGLSGAPFAADKRRMTGVDLSPRMLERAQARGCYDALIEADILAFLEADGERFDLILACDALNYFGALDRVFRAAARRLAADGRFILTVEEGAGRAELADSLRWRHSAQAVRDAADVAGLLVMRVDRADLRVQGGAPVAGLVVSCGLAAG